jgi:hypothetical protein
MKSFRPSIARTWSGRTPVSLSSAFEEHIRRTGIADALQAGAQGAMLLKEAKESHVHFLLITFWNDFESIRRFAGDQIEKAVSYPEDEQFQLLPDPYVSHLPQPSTD